MMNRFALARTSEQFQEKVKKAYRQSDEAGPNSVLTLHFGPSQDGTYYNVFFRSQADVMGKTRVFAESGMGFSETDLPMRDWAAYLKHLYGGDGTVKIVLPDGIEYAPESRGEDIARKIRSAHRWENAGITLMIVAALAGITNIVYQVYVDEAEKTKLQMQKLIDDGQIHPSLLEIKLEEPTNSAGTQQ
jgi:hypothetical protein